MHERLLVGEAAARSITYKGQHGTAEAEVRMADGRGMISEVRGAHGTAEGAGCAAAQGRSEQRRWGGRAHVGVECAEKHETQVPRAARD